MATVYEVRDRHGLRRALKILHGGGASDELERRFRREFRALSRLAHPNIARVFEWGRHEGRSFFVMELVEGVDLRQLVESWKDAPPADRFDRVRAIVVQVARALEYVHHRGLIHRDVSPSNIMLLPDGSVRLMDFGVAKENTNTDATMHGEVLGTVAYVAPEQLGGGRVDARADLYSLGSVLYFLLTGRRPFVARTVAGYVEKHLHRPPRPPRELAPGVPPLLDTVCLRLLAKDPADRYASASHLLQVLEEGRTPPITWDEAEWPPLLAGRAEAVATLLNALHAIQDGQGGVIAVRGPPGHGKSRLLRLARRQGRRMGVEVLEVKFAADRGTLQAFLPLVPVGDAEGEGEGGLPKVLSRLYARDTDTGQPVGRLEVYQGFRDVLRHGPPRVVLVDDVHHADAVAVELLEYLVRNTRGIAKDPILWVFSAVVGVAETRLDGLFRGQATEVSPQELALGPLDAAATEELAAGIFGGDEAAHALGRRLAAQGDGNPSFLAEILRGVADSRIAEAHEGRWRIVVPASEVAREVLPVPRPVRQRVRASLAPLGERAVDVARVLALARLELTAGLVAEVLEEEEEAVLEAMERLLDAGVVRERRGDTDELYELAQRGVREALTAEMGDEERRARQARLGAVLERAGRRRLATVAEALAWHFEAAGLPVKAASYLVRAGQRLAGRSFVGEARELFDRALGLEAAVRGQLPIDDADRLYCDALLARAETLDHLGLNAEQAADLRRAEGLARELGDDRLLSRALAGLGGVARRFEDLDRAEQYLADALRAADRAGDASLRTGPLQRLGGVRWARHDLEGARRHWAELHALGEARRDDVALAFGQNGLGLVALSRGQLAEARRAYELSSELFERLSMLHPLFVARVNLIEIHHFTGNLRRGLELAERSVVHARESGFQLGMSRAKCFRSLLLVDLGRMEEALQEALEAVSIARALGDGDEEVACQVNAIRAVWAMGDAEGARALLHELMPVIERHDAEGFLPLVHAWWARVAAGEGDRAAAEAHLKRATEAGQSRWAYQECRIDLALARAFAALGDRAEAARRAEASLRRADAGGFRFYALKSHSLAMAYSDEEATVARHRRVAEALARSLAANLPPADAERFLQLHAGRTGPGERPVPDPTA